jgi:translocation and assembly module TamA
MKRIIFARFIFVLLLLLTLSMPLCAAASGLHIQIRGIGNGNLFNNVTTMLSAKQMSLPIPLTDTTVNAFHTEAPQIIKDALQPYGYFAVQVMVRLIKKQSDWYAYYTIKLGPAVKITKLDFTISGDGANDPAFKRVIANFPLHVGQKLNIELYNLANRTLFDTAFNNGYLDAIFAKKSIVIDVPHQQALITLHFVTGPQYFFGATAFNSSIFGKDFLKRFLPYNSGEVYSSAKVDKLRDALTNSRLFSSVDVRPRLEGKHDLTIPVDVAVEPRKGKQYSFGLGYGTDTGVRGLVGLEIRHIGSNGSSFKSTARVSGPKSNIEAHYLIPGLNPVTDQYDISAVAENQNLDLGHGTMAQLACAYMTNINDWQQVLKLSLHQEYYKLTDSPKNNSFLVLPSINWLRTTADDPIIPNSGYSINFSVQGAARALLSSATFLQTKVDAKYVHPLGNSFQIALRATLGYTFINSIEEVPLSLQYFAGGTQSVRGYGYESIGPGHNIFVGSAELRYRVLNNWYAIGFIDAGDVSGKFIPDLKKGEGVGVMWRSPVGLASLTYAKAVDLPGHPGRVQFSIGPEF